MPVTEIACATNGFEPAHRSYPPLAQRAPLLVIPFQPVVQIFRGVLLDVWKQRAQGRGVACGFAQRAPGRHLRRGRATRLNGCLEKRLGCDRVAPVAEVDFDDLPVLVGRPVQVVPVLCTLDIGLIQTPAPTDCGPMRACCINETRRCPQGQGAHPIVDGARIDSDAAFSEPLADVGVAEAKAQLPAHGEGNYLVGEAVTAER